jgi:hypothetical protein
LKFSEVDRWSYSAKLVLLTLSNGNHTREFSER